MRLIRSILTVLLIASLAATPAAARAAMAATDAPSAPGLTHAHHGDMTGMQDCHGMVHKAGERDQSDHALHEPLSHEKCPDCDKHKSCGADVCQLKCFKVFGALDDSVTPNDISPELYAAASPWAREPLSWKPRTPPPRS